MEMFEKVVKKIINEAVNAQGVIIVECILFISSIVFLIKQNNFNTYLKNKSSNSDDIGDSILKALSPDIYKPSGKLFLFGIVLLAFLILINFYLLKNGYNALPILFGIINLIMIIFILKALLAPNFIRVIVEVSFPVIIILSFIIKQDN